MLFVDVDSLKSINDTFGHAAGDEAIAETGALLRDVFRTADAIGRYGGDEFCVLALTTAPIPQTSSGIGSTTRSRTAPAATIEDSRCQ